MINYFESEEQANEYIDKHFNDIPVMSEKEFGIMIAALMWQVSRFKKVKILKFIESLTKKRGHLTKDILVFDFIEEKIIKNRKNIKSKTNPFSHLEEIWHNYLDDRLDSETAQKHGGKDAFLSYDNRNEGPIARSDAIDGEKIFEKEWGESDSKQKTTKKEWEEKGTENDLDIDCQELSSNAFTAVDGEKSNGQC